MKYARKKDANHNDIADAFIHLGYYVCDTSRVGSGFPDMLIARGMKTAFVEVKQGKEKLSEGQNEFRKRWPGLFFVCRSVEDALKAHYSMTGNT